MVQLLLPLHPCLKPAPLTGSTLKEVPGGGGDQGGEGLGYWGGEGEFRVSPPDQAQVPASPCWEHDSPQKGQGRCSYWGGGEGRGRRAQPA